MPPEIYKPCRKKNRICGVNMDRTIQKIKGAAMFEYILIVGLIAAVSVLAMTAVGINLTGFFTNLSSVLSNIIS
jgi:Flp pilus assembly pilin Flp